MSVRYAFEKQMGTVFVLWDGIVTGEDWHKYLSELFADPGFFTMRQIVLDARTVLDDSFVRVRDIKAITAFLRTQTNLLKNKKIAVLVNTKFDKARKIQTAFSGLGLSIIFFNGLDTACAFLGLSLLDAEQRLEQLRARLHTTEL
jgi:hypothetical protein